MHILHFTSTAQSETAAAVAQAVARLGGHQTIVLVAPAGGEPREHEVPCRVNDLTLGPGSAAEQSAEVMTGVERALAGSLPEFLVVYAADDAALAATLAAVKLGIAVARVALVDAAASESNRILIDRLATVVFETIERGAADAAARIAARLAEEARLQPGGCPDRDLKPPPVERIIEARI